MKTSELIEQEITFIEYVKQNISLILFFLFSGWLIISVDYFFQKKVKQDSEYLHSRIQAQSFMRIVRQIDERYLEKYLGYPEGRPIRFNREMTIKHRIHYMEALACSGQGDRVKENNMGELLSNQKNNQHHN